MRGVESASTWVVRVVRQDVVRCCWSRRCGGDPWGHPHTYGMMRRTGQPPAACMAACMSFTAASGVFWPWIAAKKLSWMAWVTAG